ncbi:MAG TPA: ion channel [Chitinophagaceae bacterium]|nr:ion channel [Chitinophagaceae bacterium]
MATLRNNSKSINNSGFSANTSAEGGRLVNKDGSINLKKTGMSFLDRMSWYHLLLRLSRLKFLLFVFLFYTVVNTLFAFVYVTIGIEHLKGTDPGGSLANQFQQAFFFSSQTLTTVGYGHISPEGLVANIVASLESFAGIMSFALVTGLFFARFSRPKAYLKFSEHILVAPHKGGTALMCRVAAQKNNHLTDAEAQATIAFHVAEEGRKVTKFFQLPLEISSINSLALSWTIVHVIDEQSPLWGFGEADLQQSDIEVMVGVKAFDDHYSNTVQQRTSYDASELVYGAKFLPAFQRSADGGHTLLELDKLDRYERVKIESNSFNTAVTTAN